MHSTINTPVLLLLWRRPQNLVRQIEVLKHVGVKNLFIACDGYTGNEIVDRDVEQVRESIGRLVDWDCHVELLMHEACLGCKDSVSSSIGWFFKNVREGIILEDDCIPEHSFFRYCEVMLDSFRSNQKIMMISGRNELGSWKSEQYDYFYSDGGIWGWATWADRWSRYESNVICMGGRDSLEKVKRHYGTRLFLQLLPGFNAAVQGRVDSWAYPWKWRRALDGGLSVTPAINLISNIGFGEEDSTHTKRLRRDIAYNGNRCLDLFNPKGPAKIEMDKSYAYRAIARHGILRVVYRSVIGRLIAARWRRGTDNSSTILLESRSTYHKAVRHGRRICKDICNLFSLSKTQYELSELLEGKTCCVVGSSPDVDISLILKADVVVSVNRSAANIVRLTGKAPDISILDYELVLSDHGGTFKRARNPVITDQLLGNMDLGYLVLAQSNEAEITERDLGLKRSNTRLIRRASIRKVLIGITGNKLIDMNLRTAPSRGAVSLGICAWAGAKQILFTGFSIFRSSDGNETGDFFYGQMGVQVERDGLKINSPRTSPKDNVRYHSLADSLIIGSLVAKGYRLYTSTVDFFPVLFNWGR